MISQALRTAALAAAVVVSCSSPAAAATADDPFADIVIDYDPGTAPTAGYTQPAVALGSPERCTGEELGFPGVVSPFNPPFGSDEIVSIGFGGSLTVQFLFPVTDDPANPHGIDLLVFGNAFLVDTAYPLGIVGGVFGSGGVVDVSADGVTWTTVPDVDAIGTFPTMGYRDAMPYATAAGVVPTSFTRPPDPSQSVDDMLGMDEMQVRTVYGGSGGGVGIDLASVGLAAISYVRVRNPADARAAIAIDAFADVSEVLAGDANDDGVVNVNDLVAVISAWGPAGPLSIGDVNGDLVIDVDDLVLVIEHWS